MPLTHITAAHDFNRGSSSVLSGCGAPWWRLVLEQKERHRAEADQSAEYGHRDGRHRLLGFGIAHGEEDRKAKAQERSDSQRHAGMVVTDERQSDGDYSGRASGNERRL
jgi:hypothetical protein